MCDLNKYKKMYSDISMLQPNETMELILQAESDEERCFFELIGNFLLQQSQKKSIRENVF